MKTAFLGTMVVAMAFAGCIQQAAPADPQALTTEGLPDVSTLEPVIAIWEGRVTASPLGALAHNRDTELMVADVQREGLVFEVTEPPLDFAVELAWEGMANMLVMVSSPSVDGKGVEYFSDMVAESPVCIRIPAAEIIPGKWQVMAHSRDTVDVDFTFTMTTLGGAAAILEGEPHSSAEATETTEGEALACMDEAEA